MAGTLFALNIPINLGVMATFNNHHNVEFGVKILALPIGKIDYVTIRTFNFALGYSYIF